MSALREALRRRATKMTHYRLPVRSYEEAQAAGERLRQANATLQATRFVAERDDDPQAGAEVDRAQRAVEEAQAGVDACFHRITFAGLPAADFDALVQLHPPTEEQLQQASRVGDEPPMWDLDSFLPALLEASTQDSELTAAEWAAELTGWTRAERAELAARVLEASVRSFSAALDFG